MKMRLTKLPNLPRGTAPSGDHTCGAIRSSSRDGQNKEGQGASSPPGCHFLTFNCTKSIAGKSEASIWPSVMEERQGVRGKQRKTGRE